MSLTVRLLLIATLLLSIVIPFGYFLIGQRTKKRYKRAIGTNVFFFFSTVLIAGIMLFAGDPVQAAEATGNTASNATGFGYLAASTFNRSFLRRWWYRRCKCSKCGSWGNQRGFQCTW